MGRTVAWTQEGLENQFSKLYEASKEERGYFERDSAFWAVYGSRRVRNLRRRKKATVSSKLRVRYKAELKSVKSSAPKLGRQPPGAYCEVREEGYDFDAPQAYERTEINGTHHETFRFVEGDAVWMKPTETAEVVLKRTESFPGWRTLDVGGSGMGKRLHVRVCGGWYERESEREEEG